MQLQMDRIYNSHMHILWYCNNSVSCTLKCILLQRMTRHILSTGPQACFTHVAIARSATSEIARVGTLRTDGVIGVARILSGGALFLAKKVDDLFLVVALKDRLNVPPNLTRPAKTVLKLILLWLGGCWGCTSCPGVHLHIFPVNYAWKKIFHRPGECRHMYPLHPLATLIGRTDRHTDRQSRRSYYSALYCEQCGLGLTGVRKWTGQSGNQIDRPGKKFTHYRTM